MKKKYILVTFILILSLVSGCGKTAKESENSLYVDSSRVYKCVIGMEDDNNDGWWTEVYDERTKQFFADKFGLDIVFRRYDPDASPEMNFSGNDAIDLMISTTYIPEEYKEGYLVDMNEYRNKMPNYWNKWMEKGSNWEREFNKRASIITDVENNKLYGVPSINNFSFPSLVWMYKEDAFKKYGIEFPSTIEELYQIALELKEKTGKQPIWFYGDTLAPCIMSAYGTKYDSLYMDMEKNEYRYSLLDETWLDAIKMVQNMQNNELVIIGHPDGGRKIDENAMITCAFPGNLNILINQDASWKLVSNVLTSEKSNNPATYLFLTPQKKFYYINANSNDEVKKRLIALINWLATEEGIMKAWFGEEGKTYKLNNNIIEFVFSGVSHIDCVAGALTDDVGTKGIKGKFKEFHNYALGRPFFIASPNWEMYQGEELNVYTEAFEIVKNSRVIETINIDEIEAKTNEKYWNIFNEITKRESQFFKHLKSTAWRDLEIKYKEFVDDIEKIRIHELLDYLNDKIN